MEEHDPAAKWPVIFSSSGKGGSFLPNKVNTVKGFSAGLIFGRAYFQRGLLAEGILRFKI